MKRKDKEILTGIFFMVGSSVIKDKQQSAECFFKGLSYLLPKNIEHPKPLTEQELKEFRDSLDIEDIDFTEVKD